MNNMLNTFERGFRVVIGGAAIAPVVACAEIPPTAIFTLAILNIYFSMTAITGLDPVYAALTTAAKYIGRGQQSAMPQADVSGAF